MEAAPGHLHTVMSCYHILGDGLAGLLLALRLTAEGHQVMVYGDGQSATPPVALVHLFAGRTFRRSALELQAFECAIDFWRRESLAREMPVRRKVLPGDRLDRSSTDHQLPIAYAPRRTPEGRLEYGPGFAVAAQQLEARLREMVDVQPGQHALDSLPGPRILAVGARASELFPAQSWDLTRGTVSLAPTSQGQPNRIEIGPGVHVVPDPGGSGVALGGGSSSQTVVDQLRYARELTGVDYQPEQSWHGRRCAPALDRRPLLGWVSAENFAFFGFGSRALFWLPFCLELAVRGLKGAPLPSELAVQRLDLRRWDPA